MSDPFYYSTNSIQEYKTCAGLNWSNKPTDKTRCINKVGNFCQRCTEDLIQSEIAERVTGEDL